MNKRTGLSGLLKAGLVVAAAVILPACGGGGSHDHDHGHVPPPPGGGFPHNPPVDAGDAFEPNDWLEMAAPIWDFGTVELDLTLWGPGDEDWFSVEAYAGFPIIAQLWNLPADYDVFIVHPLGYVVASSTNGGTFSEWCSYVPWADDVFYIQVVGFNGESSPFPFTLSITN